MLPRKHLEEMRHRLNSVGKERRRNSALKILENGTPFPKPVEYADIDAEFFKWVDETLDISYAGKKLPTYKLFSNQRLSEYSQTWSNMDETNSLVLNFKTITRDNNPQKGENQGSIFNVPVDRDYPMFYVPKVGENGLEYYEVFTMKQPMSVNFMYTVSIVCSKYELLNEFNQMMHREFNALEKYIFPNEHAMPMILDNITDSSEYSIDDRKYYSQSFQIKLMAYIIRKEDFKVKHVPSRLIIKMSDTNKVEKYNKVRACESWLGEKKKNIKIDINEKDRKEKTNIDELERNRLDFLPIEICEPLVEINEPKRPTLRVEEDDTQCDNACRPKEKSPYYNRIVKFIVDFPYCEERSIKFTVDKEEVDIDSISLNNVHDFVIRQNGEVIDFENETDISFVEGDEIEVVITREDEYGDSSLTIIGSDPNVVIDSRYNPESALDDIPNEEDIVVKHKMSEP